MRTWFPGLRARTESVLSLRHPWRYSPPAILAGSFLLLIAIGTVLLWLPVSGTPPLTFFQALFTACSAVTVTGLVVVDTGSHLSPFGQSVVLGLMQLGGLGLMTFAALTLMALGGRLGLRGQRLVREATDQTSPADMLVLVRHTALLALIMEAIGAGLLSVVWIPELGVARGLWFSIFHSVSAFNNAGFALLPDSLSRWAANPMVNLVITALFIIGGLGFTVLLDLWRKRQWRTLSLHSKLTLAGTLVLCLGAWFLVIGFEWNNARTFGELPESGRLWAAWFTAVTPRTAGFNTVDMGSLMAPTVLLIMFLMFIGGGSNSTASGIKVSTFMVMLLATRAFLRGRQRPTVFRRAIAVESVFRAQTVVMLSLLAVVLSGFLMVVLEPALPVMDVLFEAFSAFSTVGLSRGITGELSWPSQCVLMLLMFMGRIGPLALAFSLARPQTPKLRYVEDHVQIG
ncbi:TrkH family potassium uptake protein [Alcanivorax sp. 24]|uniref:TrkH family potassium uptake protein n=1 Tax=Alcanivorax sp. 24 TaxID=2545266 RepID=UPI00105C7689|nr:TrkH family potassium uptake protein [Alcanivorax sp. 24]